MRHAGQQFCLSDLPLSHDRANGSYNGMSDDGVPFTLTITSSERRANGHELVKSQMNAMVQGRAMRHSDLYKEEPEISLLIARSQRMDIRINPNRTYGCGRDFGRTLRELVTVLVERYGAEHDSVSKPSSSSSGPRL